MHDGDETVVDVSHIASLCPGNSYLILQHPEERAPHEHRVAVETYLIIAFTQQIKIVSHNKSKHSRHMLAYVLVHTGFVLLLLVEPREELVELQVRVAEAISDKTLGQF
jgi:hypothetical protein